MVMQVLVEKVTAIQTSSLLSVCHFSQPILLSPLIHWSDVNLYGNPGEKSEHCGKKVEITNMDNNKSVVVTIVGQYLILYMFISNQRSIY